MKKMIITDSIAALFILLFIYASASKLLAFQQFRVQVGQSPILTAFAGWIVWIIPAIEIVIALLLASSKYRLAGLYGSFHLMLLFTGYIIAITRFSDYVPCSCGGILQKMNWNQHLLFNLVFVLAGLTGILFYPSSPGKEKPATKS